MAPLIHWLVRVLHVINDLRIGGAETLLRDLGPALNTPGVEIEVAALARADTFLEAEIAESGTRLHVGPHGVYDPRSALWLGRLAAEFDLVHVHLWPAQLWAAMGVPKRVPLVTTEHNTDNRRRRSPVVFRPLDALTYRRYAGIVAVSEEVKAALTRWLPATAPRATVIENGLPLERFENVVPLPRESLDVSPDAPVIVCVGRMEPVKDHATLLRALAALDGCFLALAGDGPLRADLEALAATLGVAGRVRFLGRIAGVPELLAAADVYVQPSRHEGFPRATGEALASGLPVVVSDGPGFAELVAGAGLTFPVGDESALVLTVRRALDRRIELGARSLARAKTLSIVDCASRHLALYEAILAQDKI